MDLLSKFGIYSKNKPAELTKVELAFLSPCFKKWHMETFQFLFGSYSGVCILKSGYLNSLNSNPIFKQNTPIKNIGATIVAHGFQVH